MSPIRHYDFIKLNNVDAAARAVQAIVSSGESLQENPALHNRGMN